MLLKKKLLSLLAIGLVMTPTIGNADEAAIDDIKNNQSVVNLTDVSQKAKNFISNDGSINTNSEYNSELVDTTDVQLDLVYVNVKRDIKDIVVEYDKTDEYVEAVIKDKNSGEMLETYREIFHSNNGISLRNSVIFRTLQVDYKVGPSIVRTTCVAEIWSSGSFRQINAKPIDAKSLPGNSGIYVLEGASATITTNSYPTTSVNCNISGNVLVTLVGGLSAEFSSSKLISAGFTISSNYYARKWYSAVINFSVY